MASNWVPIRLGDVCTKIGSGATPRGGSDVYLASGPYSLIRSQNVYNDGFHHAGLAYIGKQHARELDNVEVLEGDVLLNITGDSVARACQVDPRILPARVNQHVAIIRPDPSALDPSFLRYFLVSPEIQARLLSWAGSGGTRNALTKGMIDSLEVLAPRNVSEQQAIAYILRSLDDKIELHRRMNVTLEAMARALFKSWFVDWDPVRARSGSRASAFPNDLTDFIPARLTDAERGEIRQGWSTSTIADLSMLNPETWSKESRPLEIHYVDLSNTKWGRIEAVAVHSSAAAPSRAQRVLRPGDTIIGTVRPGNGSYAFIFEEGLTGSTGFAVLRPKRREYAEFVYLAASSRDNIEALSHVSDGGAYPAVRPEVVAATPIVRVADEVLVKFSQVAGPLLARMAANEKSSRTLASLRDTLLPKLMSGRLRVKDAERHADAAV